MFCKENALKDFANFTEKHLYWSLFLIKMQVWRCGTLLKRNSNIAKVFRAPIPKNICERLLLYIWNLNCKYFLTSSALQTLVPLNLYLFLRLSCLPNIFNVSYSNSLNRLNTVSPYLYKSAMHRTWVLALFSKAV